MPAALVARSHRNWPQPWKQLAFAQIQSTNSWRTFRNQKANKVSLARA
jgi:hypothetical protein